MRPARSTSDTPLQPKIAIARLELQPGAEHDPPGAGLPVARNHGAGDHPEIAGAAAGQGQAGIVEIRVIEQIIEVERHCKGDLLPKRNPFSNRSIDVPERQTVQRMTVTIYVLAELHVTEIGR